MRNGLYFVIGLAVFFSGLFGNIFIHPSLSALIIISIIMLVHWNTISYLWKCEKCGSIFEIDFFQNLLGLNGGVNFKLLYCKECQKRRWCKGVPKDN